MLDTREIKKDFPIFNLRPDLVYLDSAATSLKPIPVINKLNEYYKTYSANIHRGIYDIAEKATSEYEETRKVVSKFIHANRPEEVIFTKGTTESLNLLASTIGLDILTEGDEIVTTIMEHHSNFVPWQHLAMRTGALLKVIDLNDRFELAISDKKGINLEGVITKNTKIFAFTYVSNTLGTKNPVKEIINAAKKINPSIITIVDAAQAVPHMKIDVQELGCDFLAFSGHKMLGPTGVGVLWGKYKLLQEMSPYQFGGEMIRSVTLESTTFNDVPHKFEAGTPPIAEVIALKEAISYLSYFNLGDIEDHEQKLKEYALNKFDLEFGEQFHYIGNPHLEKTGGIITFTFGSIHPHDIAQVLNDHEIAIRAGHHCTMPLHTYLELPATARVSLYLYNDEKDIDILIEALKNAQHIFKK